MSAIYCEHESGWDLFCLGALPRSEQAEMQRHLDRGCALCAMAYEEAAALMPYLSLLAPDAMPSHAVEMQLAARVASIPANASWNRAWVWRAAAVILFCLLAADWFRLRHELSKRPRQLISAAPPVVVLKQPEPPLVVAVPKKPAPMAHARVAAPATKQNNTEKELDRALAESENRVRDLERRSHEDNAARAAQIAQLRTEMDKKAAAAPASVAPAPIPESPPTQVVRVVDLRGVDPGAGRATARALIGKDGGVTIIADQLPQLPSTKCYQVWLIRRANPSIVSGGVISLGRAGRGVLVAPGIHDTSNITALAITDEPAGGSSSAKGHKLLFGAL